MSLPNDVTTAITNLDAAAKAVNARVLGAAQAADFSDSPKRVYDRAQDLRLVLAPYANGSLSGTASCSACVHSGAAAEMAEVFGILLLKGGVIG